MLDRDTAPGQPAAPTPPGMLPSPKRVSGLQWGSRASLIVACLAVLVWSWRDSEINPSLLIERAQRAQEYIFGRPIDDAARTQAREQAARLVEMGIEREVDSRLRRELGIGREDAAPPGYEDRLDDAVTQRIDALGPDAYDNLIDARQNQIIRQSRGGYFPPETGRENLRLYATSLLETVAIAVWGTLIAMVLAVPAALFAAGRSMSILIPGSGPINQASRSAGVFITRRMFDVCRGFNEFVLALIFVAIVGLGPFAGVMALAVHTFGVLGKVISEAIEAAKTPEIEGVSAVGAGPVQVVSYAVIPQVMPYIVSQSLLRFESNVRSASVLGLVGAGGIGFLIDAKLKAYKFTEVATIMILVIIAVTIIDFICSRIMKRLI